MRSPEAFAGDSRKTRWYSLGAMSTRDSDHFETLAIHAGQRPDPTTGAVMTPVYLTSTYAQEGPGEHKGFEYSRTRNPTRDALQGCLAALEGGKHALAFASGLAATDAVLHLCNAGDHVVLGDDLYGGTFRIADKVFKRLGIDLSFVNMTDPPKVERAITPKTRLLWTETPTNPMLKIVDLAAVAEICRKRGIVSVCDNTFATPFFQRPLELGFDVVAHSMTKYLNGHSDVVAGALVLRRDDLHEKLAFLQNAVAAKQMRGFGGMLTCVVRGGLPAARTVLKSVRLFTCAESLGGVESLIEHPAIMTHAAVPPETRRQLGIDDGFIRLSVGIENGQDLVDDLAQALDRA